MELFGIKKRHELKLIQLQTPPPKKKTKEKGQKTYLFDKHWYD